MSIYKNKNKYWISIYHERKRIRRASPENTYAGAKAYESVLRQKLARGEGIIEKIEDDKPIPNFNDFTQRWFDVYVKNNNKHSEILNKASVLRAHLNPYFGKKALNKISNFDIENYKALKIKSKQSNKSINNHLIVLNKCLRTAQEWEVVESIPKIKLLKIPPQKFDFLNIEECELLLNNSIGVLREMILFGLKTGLRFGELIALNWNDINFQNNIIVVQKSISRGIMGSTKSNRIRYIPLSNDLLQILILRLKNKGFVFCDKDDKFLNPVTCQRWLHKACNKAGLRKIGWHTLRHTFASHLAQNGVSVVLIKGLLGHADIKTTMRYSHLTSLEFKGAIESLDEKFGHNIVIPIKTKDNNYFLSDKKETENANISQ
jgi:integrase